MTVLPDITLDQLRLMMARNGVTKLLVKPLSANDNSKNQPYLGGSLEAANILPVGEVRAEVTAKGNRSLKAPLPFWWLQPDGGVAPAPGAQLILYPQYPEVRLSGFLKGAVNAPNELLNNRAEGRLLFLGITGDQRIIAWACGADTRLAREYASLGQLEQTGVFFVVPLSKAETGFSTRDLLLAELRRIHLLDWIGSKALNSDGTLRPCLSSHCVGYTLEAELGVPRNGKAEPDFKGWEIKAGLVTDFRKPPAAKAITLMTPEPTGGFYRRQGVAAFIRKFGYADKLGRPDRLNFGGTFRAGERHAGTGLTLTLQGYDATSGKITDPQGALALISDSGEIAAEWTIAALLTLWNRKHAQAAYVPAEKRDRNGPQYRYGNNVRLAEGTDISRLLAAIAAGRVYYDPGIKLENASTGDASTKRRSQFRVKANELAALYAKMDLVRLVN